MNSIKVAITVDSDTLTQVDSLVSACVFPSLSRAIQLAVAEKLARMRRSRLALECAKLDLDLERALADEAMATELQT